MVGALCHVRRESFDCLHCRDLPLSPCSKMALCVRSISGRLKATISKDKQDPARGENSLWEARKAASRTALSSRKQSLQVHAKQPRRFPGSLRLWILR